MSVTKTPYDHSYYFLQCAKEEAKKDGCDWDKLSKEVRDKYEDFVRSREQRTVGIVEQS